MKVIVFGASGMIGSAMFRILRADDRLAVWGTVRTPAAFEHFSAAERDQLLLTGDITNHDHLVQVFGAVPPDLVVNCIGLTKHHKSSEQALAALPLNALLPFRLAELCKVAGARLIHISTDCVFSGTRGNYSETDLPDATDLYGRSKALGEVVGYTNAVTLRTSTIGHELQTAFGLLEWFLSQQGSCKGYRHAIFSGLPNTVLAEVVRDYVIPNPALSGLYHVGGEPIGKYALLQRIADVYDKQIDIVPDDQFVIDRSLDNARFQAATGFKAAPWPQLIQQMHAKR